MWFGYGRSIRSVEADGSGLTELAGGVKGDGSISWSPDGTRIVYERWRSAYVPDEIWTADVDRPANEVDLTGGSGPDSGPLWSPDGSLIAFQRREGRGRWDLWVRGANGTCARRLTHAAGRKDDAVGYSWSPDGRRLAFFQHRGLFVVDRDGAERRAVAADLPYLRQASWSPDGQQLLIVAGHYQDDFELYAADAGGGAISRLTENDRLEDGPVWAPDGSSIVFMTTSRTGFELHSVDLAGNENRLTHGFGDYFPSWSPDGTKIAFSREEAPEGHADIWVMDADGGGEIDITRSMPRDHYYTQLEWQPRP